MHIYGPSQVHGSHPINAPHFTQRTHGSSAPSANRGADRVEISAAAQAASETSEVAGVRHELVNLIRNQIAAGTYDTPDKMEAALERLFDQIG